MTHIANRCKNHINVRHNPGEGTWPKTEKCPDEATFDLFNEIADANRAAGLPVLSIAETLPHHFPQHPSLNKPTASDPAPYTLREWVGTPNDPGPYWEFSAIRLSNPIPSEPRRRFIFNLLDWLGDEVVDLPMTKITRHHIQNAYERLLVCKACVARAKRRGRDDLLACPEEHLSAAVKPILGPCEDDEEQSTHHPDYRNTTIDDKLRSASLFFRVAQYAGAAPERLDERCSPTQHDPFKQIARRQYIEKPGRLDHAFALTHGEVWVLDGLMPDALGSSVPFATYCMLRRGELCGVSIGDLELPADGGPGMVFVRNTLTLDGLVSRGKTDGSTGTRVPIPAEVVKGLLRYIHSFRSTPNPAVCTACRDGFTHHHNDGRTKNPHRGCDFAASAPLYVNPGHPDQRLSREDFSDYFGKAVAAAGLDQGKYTPTPHTLRASGATYLLQSGTLESEVMKLGRWANLQVVLKHYFRPLDSHLRESAERMDAQIRATNGNAHELDENSLTETQRLMLQIEQLQAENAALKANGHSTNSTRIRPRKPSFDEDDLRTELPLSRNETDLCIRLGTTGGRNTRNRVRRMIQELDLVPPWSRGRAA